jgi:hypothetical protein
VPGPSGTSVGRVFVAVGVRVGVPVGSVETFVCVAILVREGVNVTVASGVRVEVSVRTMIPKGGVADLVPALMIMIGSVALLAVCADNVLRWLFVDEPEDELLILWAVMTKPGLDESDDYRMSPAWRFRCGYSGSCRSIDT